MYPQIAVAAASHIGDDSNRDRGRDVLRGVKNHRFLPLV